MLFVRLGNAVFIVVTHLQIERHAGNRCRYLNTLCAKEKLVILKYPDYLAANASSLIFRVNKNGKEAALIFLAPIRSDGAAADYRIAVSYDVEVSPRSKLKHVLRCLSLDQLIHQVFRIILLVRDADRLSYKG